MQVESVPKRMAYKRKEYGEMFDKLKAIRGPNGLIGTKRPRKSKDTLQTEIDDFYGKSPTA